MTSNLKLRRALLVAKYAAEIDGIYAILEGRTGQPNLDPRGDSAAPLVRET